MEEAADVSVNIPMRAGQTQETVPADTAASAGRTAAMRRRGRLWIMIFLAAAAVFYYAYVSYERRVEAKRILEHRRLAWAALKDSLREDIRRFSGRTGVVVRDLSTGWELYHNKDARFPAASLVKLPVMLALYEASQKGVLDLERTLQLRNSYKTGGSGVLKSLPPGSVFTVGELIERMIDSSDNTAANILIGMLDFPYFNGWFSRFGLKNTNLARKMMDFKRRAGGVENYTAAADIVYALEKLYRGEFISGDFSGRCIGLLTQQKVNDRIPAKLPPGTVVAHKTGLERRICHDAGIVFTPKGDFLICVLTRGARDSKSAKEFISTVACKVYNYYENL